MTRERGLVLAAGEIEVGHVERMGIRRDERRETIDESQSDSKHELFHAGMVA